VTIYSFVQDVEEIKIKQEGRDVFAVSITCTADNSMDMIEKTLRKNKIIRGNYSIEGNKIIVRDNMDQYPPQTYAYNAIQEVTTKHLGESQADGVMRDVIRIRERILKVLSEDLSTEYSKKRPIIKEPVN